MSNRNKISHANGEEYLEIAGDRMNHPVISVVQQHPPHILIRMASAVDMGPVIMTRTNPKKCFKMSSPTIMSLNSGQNNTKTQRFYVQDTGKTHRLPKAVYITGYMWRGHSLRRSHGHDLAVGWEFWTDFPWAVATACRSHILTRYIMGYDNVTSGKNVIRLPSRIRTERIPS